jgi:hypothetical protein
MAACANKTVKAQGPKPSVAPVCHGGNVPLTADTTRSERTFDWTTEFGNGP